MISANGLLPVTNHVYSVIFPTESIKSELAHLLQHFHERDTWLDKILEIVDSYSDRWGPRPPRFPPPVIPKDVDPVPWKRRRILDVAKKYVGIPYKHHHIPDWDGPDGNGIDCSNFTAWVYNYGLGIRFSSHIASQAEGRYAPGRIVDPHEPLKPGDLLFMVNKAKTRYTHVVIYAGKNRIIDVRGKGGVRVRKFRGWYKKRFVFGRRLIE